METWRSRAASPTRTDDDGNVLGHGLSDRAESANSGSVIARVLPEHRRRGVGTALLLRLADHVASLGLPRLRAGTDDDGSLAFAHRFGFADVNRDVEQTYVLATVPQVPPTPDGIEVVTAQERPGLWEECFEGFGREALADFAVDTPLDVSLDRWTRVWLGDPMFLALHGGEVVGCAGLGLDADDPARAENSLTAVRRRSPSGAASVRGQQWGALEATLAVAVLKDSELLFLDLDAAGRLESVRRPRELQQFGRLRSVTAARNGDLLVTTDNGVDDRILRVSPR